MNRYVLESWTDMEGVLELNIRRRDRTSILRDDIDRLDLLVNEADRLLPTFSNTQQVERLSGDPMYYTCKLRHDDASQPPEAEAFIDRLLNLADTVDHELTLELWPVAAD